MGLGRSTFYYQSRRDKDEALRIRLKELAGVRVRFGYRRLTVMLRREGWLVNHKKVYRIYKDEGLIVRTKKRKKFASKARVPLGTARGANEQWSMDFVSDRMEDGRLLRVLSVVDNFSRECLLLKADTSLTGQRVAKTLDEVARRRGYPQSIRVDNGSEFYSKAMDKWAYWHRVKLEFIRPGKPVENGYIESFHGRLRDECLNVHLFFSIEDAREKLELWRLDYNTVRPHGSLNGLTPEQYLEAHTDPREPSAPSGRYEQGVVNASMGV